MNFSQELPFPWVCSVERTIKCLENRGRMPRLRNFANTVQTIEVICKQNIASNVRNVKSMERWADDDTEKGLLLTEFDMYAPRNKINERPYHLCVQCMCIRCARVFLCRLLDGKRKPDFENSKWQTTERSIRCGEIIEMYESFWNLKRDQSIECSSSSDKVKFERTFVPQRNICIERRKAAVIHLCKYDNRSSIRSSIVFLFNIIIAVWIIVWVT